MLAGKRIKASSNSGNRFLVSPSRQLRLDLQLTPRLTPAVTLDRGVDGLGAFVIFSRSEELFGVVQIPRDRR